MQTRLVLIRHGQVDAAWRGRIYGGHDVPLSELGHAQARAAAGNLSGVPLAAVISSTLSRARIGAAAILEARQLQGQEDHDLREIERGEWVGQPVDEIGADGRLSHGQWLANPKAERPPGGEHLGDLAERVFPRLDHWCAEYSGETIAIVAHSWVIRIAICEALKLDLNASTRIQLDTGAMAVLDWSAGLEEGARDTCLVGVGLRALPAQRPWFRRPS